MDLKRLGLIGNCQVAAHVADDGAVVWSCFPRFDAPPLFGRLLDPDGGEFFIGTPDRRAGSQRYLPNTNVLETTFSTGTGSFRVVDFFPRFIHHERSFRPTMMIRMIEPLSGLPEVLVRCDPVAGWSKARPQQRQGSHHIQFVGMEGELRLTTDAPLSALGRAFVLTHPLCFVLTWGSPVEEPLRPLCQRFLDATVAYWRTWVKHCNVPTHFQELVVRSALALKLHCFEDTGAIVAALTTSIPEAPDSGRTWDYRYCWLRDSYYALNALHILGHFEEQESFLRYLLDVAGREADLKLKPLYRIDGTAKLDERVIDTWAGFRGMGPVREGNGAVTHEQHDVYGEMVLALAPLFLDVRFSDVVSAGALDLVERLADRALAVAGTPDAGIWEIRTSWRPQTFSTLMCWAAAERAARVLGKHRPERAAPFATGAARLHAHVLATAVHNDGYLVADHGGVDVDAALLQAVPLGFLRGHGELARSTVHAIQRELDSAGWLRRYKVDDGLGVPEVAFTLCTLWLVESLALLGERDEAWRIFNRVAQLPGSLGLLSEDVGPTTGELWGNFPQAYSHVGVIHAAFALSPRFGVPV